MLLNNRSKMKMLVLYMLLGLFLPFSYNCVQKILDTPEPVLPSWTTQLTIPLLDRTYYFKDLVRKDSAFSTDATTGELIYRPASLQNEPTPIVIPPLDPSTATFVRQLGLIPISAVTIPGVTMSFQDLTGQPPLGTPWPGPEVSANQNREVVGDSATYDYLVYEEGQMELTITNTFPFDVTFAPGGIALVDTTGATEVLIGTFNIGVVAKNGGTASAIISLDGKRVSSVLRMRFLFQSVDLTGKIVNASQHIAASITITRNGAGNPALSEAKMRLLEEYYLPVTSIKDSVQQLDDSTFIRTAEFTDGEFNIRIENKIPFDVVIGFNIREFRHKATNTRFRLNEAPGTGPARDSIIISGLSTNYNMRVLMKDYFMQARKVDRNDPTVNDTLTNGIHFSLDVKALVRSNEKKVIRKTDSMTVYMEPVVTPYNVDYVIGKIAPTAVTITDTVKAGLGESTDNFTADSIIFDGARIVLKIFTNSLFPTDIKFDVISVINGVPGQSLSTPPGTGINTGLNGSYRIFPGDTAKIIFEGPPLNTFLSSFEQNGKFKFPDQFLINGSAVLEPIDAYQNDSIGFVQNNDNVYTSLDFTFPLKIGIVSGSYKDTSSISANMDTAQVNSIQEGNIRFDVISTFPVGVEVRSQLLKPNPVDSLKPNATEPPVLALDTVRVEGSPDHTNKRSFSYVSLKNEDAAKISQAAFNAIDIRFQTSNGSLPVAFRSEDSIVVRSSANIKFNVDFERLK